MKRLLLMILLAFFFLVEGTLVQLFIPVAWKSEYWIVPHLTLISIILAALHLGSREGLWIGLLFGGLYDLVIGDVLGLFLFSYGVIGYVFGLLPNFLHRTFFLSCIAAGIGSISLDLLHFGLYRLFQLTSVPFSLVFYKQILPSGLLNMLLVFILYPFFRGLLKELAAQMEKGEVGG